MDHVLLDPAWYEAVKISLVEKDFSDGVVLSVSEILKKYVSACLILCYNHPDWLDASKDSSVVRALI